MTTKDFQLVADVIREVAERLSWDSGTKEYLVEKFANALAGTNPGFNHAKFHKACEE